jgi:hypothetical protein
MKRIQQNAICYHVASLSKGNFKRVIYNEQAARCFGDVMNYKLGRVKRKRPKCSELAKNQLTSGMSTTLKEIWNATYQTA